jgi:peptidyl-prolyl cis-trans isomerase C
MRRPALSALAALACVALNGCGKPASADTEPSAPLATVNGVDIRMLAPAATVVDNARMEALIDSQLLQEEAIRNKLDRDPVVQRAIAQANTDILAQAHLQRKAAALAAPTVADIEGYLAAHPELFSERKLFQIEQIVLDSKDFTPALKQRIDRAASIEQVAKWLDERAVHYTRARLARNSAELAPALLARLKTMRKHQLFVVVAGPETTLDALRDVTPAPVPQAAALAQADAILRQEGRARADQMEIKRLRAQAKIAYFKQQQGSAPTTLGALPSKPMETQ